jgi:S-adenosylmethionine hydrolase
MQSTIVTLLSDFGLRDPYVAEMKAVILSRCNKAKIVDISHEIAKFDIRMGAFVLASATPYFPKGTVHVAVVDPGVGTERRPIVMETELRYLVGPDNGVLTLAAWKEGVKHVYVIRDKRFMLPKVSKTFHGRDVFAPTAAHLAGGAAASVLGEEISNYIVPSFAKPRLEENSVLGEVLHVDGFGNIITNVQSSTLTELGIHEGDVVTVGIGNKTTALKFCSTYGGVHRGDALALVGSHDFLEISVNQGNAAERFNPNRGGSICLGRRG